MFTYVLEYSLEQLSTKLRELAGSVRPLAHVTLHNSPKFHVGLESDNYIVWGARSGRRAGRRSARSACGAATREGVTITSDNPDLGEVREELEAEFNGDPIAIGFNPKYVVELLSQMSSDQEVVHRARRDLDRASARRARSCAAARGPSGESAAADVRPGARRFWPQGALRAGRRGLARAAASLAAPSRAGLLLAHGGARERGRQGSQR
jgi:DNA polymerase III beta subunit-like protein